MIKVTRPEATMACQDYNLCDRHKAVIDDAVHGVQAICDEKSTTEDWGFLHVYSKNKFNDINGFGIM